MRILQVVHAFFPECTGGTETQTLLLGRALQDRGHTVAVFYRVFAPDLPEYVVIPGEYADLRTFKIVNNFTSRPPAPFAYHDTGVEARFLQVLDTFQPEAVHVQHLGDLSTSLVSAAQRWGIPVVLTLHDFWHMCFRSHLVNASGQLCPGPDGGLRCHECLQSQQREASSFSSVRTRTAELGFRNSVWQLPHFARTWLESILVRRNRALTADLAALSSRDEHMRRVVASADLVLSPSRFLRDQFTGWGISTDHVLYFPNGIAPGLAPQSVNGDIPTVQRFGYLGGIHPYKGLTVLVEAFNGLVDADVTLEIWGAAATPASRALTEELRQKCRNPRVRFAGSFPPSQLAHVLAGIDMLILPSTIYENSPMSILEAFSARIPVIASDIGGMAELVQHDVNGLQFRAGDPDDLAATIRFAVKHPERVHSYRGSIIPPPTADQVGAAAEKLYTDLIRIRAGSSQGKHGLADC